ncbi:hypothetical protein [Nonomuraea polychroma]|uniref:hypothetical protein n=1 Tax=Nonomuraea polychroma TaxID=46176 RepID=UPI0019D4D0C9|nr:hypothetical protein [Nonomuraea polychroma]
MKIVTIVGRAPRSSCLPFAAAIVLAGCAAQSETGAMSSQPRRGGLTLLLISHDMDVVARLADRVATLDVGRLTWEGKP